MTGNQEGDVSGAGRPTVFVSYSHKDEDWKDRLHPYLKALEQAGRVTLWDDRKIDAGADWYDDIDGAMRQAEVAVMLISQNYPASDFIQKEEVPCLIERRETEGLEVFPILIKPCPWRIFSWLRAMQMLPRDGKTVAYDYAERWEVFFADIAEQIYRRLDRPAPRPSSRRGRSGAELSVPRESRATETTALILHAPAPPEVRVDIDHLPQTGAALFGRQEELRWLDAAWDENTTNVVSLVAWGGVGKSTLVNKWLEGLQAETWRGARRVFGWSFYSQGTSDTTSSADAFIAAALDWFGDLDPAAGSPWDRGERLAGLVRKERTLLLLDGLEPLQWGHVGQRGEIKDPALARLVAELARENPGLCVLTSRQPVADLKAFPETARQRDLTLISPEAGRALLRVGGVRGSDAELEDASRAFGGHALALSLLASWLHGVPGHRIKEAPAIPACRDILLEQGRHPRRVMAAWAERFGEGPELELLRLLGLFDRPADAAALAALRAPPPIPGLTDRVHAPANDIWSRLLHRRQGMSEEGWMRLVERLRGTGLVARPSRHDPEALDAHPLVREHFGGQLRATRPAAWRAGHRRLYEHLKATAKDLPDTLVEMAPLYAAVAHGCAAGKYQEAHKLYRGRIQREEKYFSGDKLGALGADLAALSCFFVTPWTEVVDELKGDPTEGFVLYEAGFYLRGLGRTGEALVLVQKGLEVAVASEDWREASIRARLLNQTHLLLGDIPNALKVAQQAVEVADKSEDAFQRALNRSILADIWHQAGEFAKAKALFKESDDITRKMESKFGTYDWIPCYRYCDFLLSLGDFSETQKRANQYLADLKKFSWTIHHGLTSVYMGKANFLESEKRNRIKGNSERRHMSDFFDDAVHDLRKAARQDHLPRGLIARATLNRVTDDFSSARHDLDEVLAIARRGGMKLHETDAHLEYARLCLAEGNRDQARQHFKIARAAVADLGYHRRDPEVAELEQQLG